MHILLGLLAAIVTILVLLSRLADAGISLGGLNPFLWRRRRAWRQKYSANPLYSLDDPVAIAGILAFATAKADGDVSAAERQALLGEFERTFALSLRAAAELLASSAHLYADGQAVREELARVLENASTRLNAAQLESTLDLIDRIANAGSAQQRDLAARIRAALVPAAPKGTWA